MNFTSRLKLGGTGAFDAGGIPVSRVLSFPVTGNTTITVMAMSSSSSADRELVFAAGTKETVVGKFPALGASISKGEYSYTGGPTTIYIFSASSGVNLYYLKATPLTTGMNIQDKQEFKVFPNPASVFIYGRIRYRKIPCSISFRVCPDNGFLEKVFHQKEFQPIFLVWRIRYSGPAILFLTKPHFIETFRK